MNGASARLRSGGQVAWFKAQGFEPADALRALGDKRPPTWCGWDDVHAALGAAWIALQARDALLQGVRRVTRVPPDEARP